MHILTLNSGSSSIKFALYNVNTSEELIFSGRLDRSDFPESDIKALLQNTETIDAIGHRIVHGGPHYTTPCILSNEVLKTLKQMALFDPDHLPDELAIIDAVSECFPNLPQVLCFDTAFHRDIPNVAKRLAIPEKYDRAGVHRYGFHGLSYEYVLSQLSPPKGKVIICHLGNGASMAAIKEDVCIDTSMGFTPTGGFVMSTRSGDLDPGVLIYLLQEQEVSVTELSDILNKQSGLLGISGISSDMHDLLTSDSPNAKEAIEIFCYQVKKYIGSYSVALGGLDTLVFTGGIGENAPIIRKNICKNLNFLGININDEANDKNEREIFSSKSQVKVLVIPTNEELIIAKHTHRVLSKNG